MVVNGVERIQSSTMVLSHLYMSWQMEEEANFFALDRYMEGLLHELISLPPKFCDFYINVPFGTCFILLYSTMLSKQFTILKLGFSLGYSS